MRLVRWPCVWYSVLAAGVLHADAADAAEPPTLASTWAKVYVGDFHDDAQSVITLADGFVVVGETESVLREGFDAWIIKLDKTGQILWERTYGEAHPICERATAVVESGGELVATGIREDCGALTWADIFVLRLTSDGSLLWPKTMDGSQLDAA